MMVHNTPLTMEYGYYRIVLKVLTDWRRKVRKLSPNFLRSPLSEAFYPKLNWETFKNYSEMGGGRYPIHSTIGGCPQYYRRVSTVL